MQVFLKALTGNGIQGYSRYCKYKFPTLVILCDRTSPSKHLRSRDFTEVHSSSGQASSFASFILPLYMAKEPVTGVSFVKELTRKLKD